MSSNLTPSASRGLWLALALLVCGGLLAGCDGSTSDDPYAGQILRLPEHYQTSCRGHDGAVAAGRPAHFVRTAEWAQLKETGALTAALFGPPSGVHVLSLQVVTCKDGTTAYSV